MEEKPVANKTLTIAYLDLRKAVGYLGIALPVVVSLGALRFFGNAIQGSISGYYYTGMRDVFVGTLWAIGIFLWSYQGHELADQIAGHLACIFAIGVTLFPTAPDCPPLDPTLPTAPACSSPLSFSTALTVGIVHFAFATLFFLTLIYFCLFLFTKSDMDLSKTPKDADPDSKRWTRKHRRNNVYKVCGIVMLVCILFSAGYAILAYSSILPSALVKLVTNYHPLLWFEWLAIWAFGFSWLTKGQAILKDEAQPLKEAQTKSNQPAQRKTTSRR